MDSLKLYKVDVENGERYNNMGESFSGREIHGIKNNEYGLKTLCL